MKRLAGLLGIILIIGAGLWKLFLSPTYEQRFPLGWSWEFNAIGLSSYADETTGQFPEGTMLADDPINITVRYVTSSASDKAGEVVINDRYENRDPVTNAMEWELEVTSTVDSKTGKHTAGEHIGDYYFLPNQLDKNQVYHISNSSYIHLPMSFQREEVVAGINTYLYAFYGDMNNELAYAGFVTVEEGQEIICYDIALEYWVEPTTGEFVKLRENCEGDWVVDANGERLYAISRWGAESSGDDLIRQSSSVQSKLNTYNLMTLYAPVGLGILGVLLLIGSFLMPKPNTLKA